MLGRRRSEIRRLEDLDSAALTYAEVKAIASGNPLVIEKAQVDAELMRLIRLRSAHAEEQYRIRTNLRRSHEDSETFTARLSNLREDIKTRQDTSGDIRHATARSSSQQKHWSKCAVTRSGLPAPATRFARTGVSETPASKLAGVARKEAHDSPDRLTPPFVRRRRKRRQLNDATIRPLLFVAFQGRKADFCFPSVSPMNGFAVVSQIFHGKTFWVPRLARAFCPRVTIGVKGDPMNSQTDATPLELFGAMLLLHCSNLGKERTA